MLDEKVDWRYKSFPAGRPTAIRSVRARGWNVLGGDFMLPAMVLKDAALRLGALNLGMFLKAQTDTPAKLAAFAYAFEHLEVPAYELLKRVAARTGDEETVSMVDKILFDERAAAARVHSLFDNALEASLQEAGVKA